MSSSLTNDQQLLKAVVEEEWIKRAPNLKVSEYFERFCAWEILKQADPLEEVIEDGITDGGDDGGIDSIFILLDGRVVDDAPESETCRQNISVELIVIQSKYTSSISGNAVNKLHSVVPLLLKISAHISDDALLLNQAVRAKRDLFNRVLKNLASKHPNIRVTFYLCANADESSIAPNAHGWKTPIMEACKKELSRSQAEVHIWGATSLYDAHSQLPPTSYSLSLDQQPIITPQGSCVALVPLRALIEMIFDSTTGIRHNLFDSNVRDFYPQSSVNDDIISSSQSPDEMDFWWLNNGLTILASELSCTGLNLNISDPQIVNGLQTSLALARAAENGMPEACYKKNVLVKLVKQVDQVNMDRIIRATNSQNAMPPAALRALDPLQRRIEDYLRKFGFFYERRRNYYRARKEPINKILSIEYLGQALMTARLRRPNDARARPSSLLKKDPEYEAIFDPSISLDEFVICSTVTKRVDEYLESTGIPAPERTNIRFYVLMVACDLLLGTTSSPRSIADVTPADLDDELLLGSVTLVHEELANLLKSAAGSTIDQIAKGSELLGTLTDRINSLLE